MLPEATRRWFVRPRHLTAEASRALRLFCFPHAGAAASTYRPWFQELKHLDVLAVQPPGRESRLAERPFEACAPYVAALLPAMLPLLDRPFAFYGHSLGALIAFELTRALRAAGAPSPSHLFVSGRRAPHRPGQNKGMHAMSDADLLAELRFYGGTPPELLDNAELMGLMLPISRADFAIHETYTFVPSEPLDVPISALGGLGDEEVPREAIDAWRELTTGPFSLRMLPGGHFFVQEQRAAIHRAVLTDLARARR
jgi:medium-chain acyl-[acyl-carrier-protein] hydrolase